MSRRRQQTVQWDRSVGLDLSGVGVVARFYSEMAEQERPDRQPTSGKDHAYKAGELKAREPGGSPRGS